MAIEVRFTPLFEKELKQLSKKYPSIHKGIGFLIEQLEKNPKSGSPLGNNLYKVRLAISSKGKGKSGGARVITYVLIKNEKVYLASIYDKSEHETVDKERLYKILQRLFK